jgi:uncharacterized membrane protein
MQWDLNKHLFALAMIVAAGLAAVYFSTVLPGVIPSHFAADGMPDRWSPKAEVILVSVGIVVGIFVLLTFLPLVDPFWKKIQGKYNLFLIFRDIAMGSAVYFTVLVYVSARERAFATHLTSLGFGLMLMLIGNYLPKLPRNFFFGIRTPWTLASEQVWKHTHRLSGWLFVLGGGILVIASFTQIPPATALLTVLVPLVVFCSLVYPYFLYRKVEREGKARIPQL